MTGTVLCSTVFNIYYHGKSLTEDVILDYTNKYINNLNINKLRG